MNKMNTEKCNRIANMIKSNSKAIRAEFYYESVVILYNLIDDRLDSILVQLLAFERITGKKCNLHGYGKKWSILRKALIGKNTKKQFRFSNISAKIELLKTVFQRAKEWTNSNDSYMVSLSKTFLNTKIKKLNELLEVVDNWRCGRNELIHNMLGRPYQENEMNAKKLAFEGKIVFRKLDSYAKKMDGMVNRYLVEEYKKKNMRNTK